MHVTVHRPATDQRVRLGATPDGQLTAMSQMISHSATGTANFTEHARQLRAQLYAAPNRLTGHRLVRARPAGRRAPCARRARRRARSASKWPWTSWPRSSAWTRGAAHPQRADGRSGDRHARSPSASWSRCMREGAQQFGWDQRNRAARHAARRPLAGRPGHGGRDPRQLPAAGQGQLHGAHGEDRQVTVEQGMTDIGTGTYTVLAQIAAETLGVPLGDVRGEDRRLELHAGAGLRRPVRRGDAGSAVRDAGMKLQDRSVDRLAASGAAADLPTRRTNRSDGSTTAADPDLSTTRSSPTRWRATAPTSSRSASIRRPARSACAACWASSRPAASSTPRPPARS